MKLKRVWLTCGIPGSGKSTVLSKRIAAAEPETAVIISRDMIRFSLLGDSDDYFSKEDEVWDLFVRAAQAAINDPFINDIYIDATHLNAKSRSKVLNALDLQTAETGCLVFDVPLVTCFERNDQRSGRAFVPRSAIRRMSYTFAHPTLDEGFSIIEFIDADGNVKRTEVKTNE